MLSRRKAYILSITIINIEFKFMAHLRKKESARFADPCEFESEDSEKINCLNVRFLRLNVKNVIILPPTTESSIPNLLCATVAC